MSRICAFGASATPRATRVRAALLALRAFASKRALESRTLSELMARIDMDVPGNQVDVAAPYNDGIARNFGFRRVGTTLDLRVGGASVADMTQVGSVDVSAAGIAVHIGL